MSRPTPLNEVFARALPAVRPLLSFDDARLLMTQEREPYSERFCSLLSVDPVCIADTSNALDAKSDGDRTLLEAGVRSLLVVPIAADGRLLGHLLLASASPFRFELADAAKVTALAELLSMAAEHERLWMQQEARQQRRSKMEALLPALAEALDVRHVFLGMSKVIQEIVPHDILAFSLLNKDRTGVRVQAATHMGLLELPEYRFSNPEEALDANWEYLLSYDLSPTNETTLRVRISPREVPEPAYVEVRPGRPWVAFVQKAGIRSTLRVPIRAKGQPIGGVGFFSFRPDTYDEEDGALALRIADHIALALAHQELAEEAQRIAQAEERAAQLESKVDTLSRELERFSSHRAVGQSKAWKKVLADATQVAATDTTVLITGESGTGKEVVARYIHRGSPRAHGPFVALNCAALPEQLLESELFGHERGAFTGALQSYAGKIEQAAGGVLFLDEVGEMSPPVQAKFLRVLQERDFQRLGSSKTLKANVRFVAATNRDPRRAMETGAFREDLYYRLSVFEIHLPPLRQRPEDVLALAEAFLDEIGTGIGRPAAGISEDAREHLLTHGWPGNVRELKNAIERAVILCNGGLVTREHLPMAVASKVSSREAPTPSILPESNTRLDVVEREMLEKAMARARDNKTQAAKLLGLSRGQLYSLLRRHGMTNARR